MLCAFEFPGITMFFFPCHYLFENEEGKAMVELFYYYALGHLLDLRKGLGHQVVQSFYFYG